MFSVTTNPEKGGVGKGKGEVEEAESEGDVRTEYSSETHTMLVLQVEEEGVS